MKKLTPISLAITSAIFISACGGDNHSSSQPVMGSFTLGVSDNPANAKSVNIAFKQVVLKNSEGATSFDVSSDGSSQQIDLLTVQGSQVAPLITGQSIPLGEYQMCIYIENSEVANTDSSYVLTQDDIEAGLVTNSNGSCGGVGADDTDTGRLFFNKSFTIAAGQNNFVAEFDLSKGLQAPHGNKDYWTLKPTSVQLVNTAEVGGIKGIVSDDVMTSCEVAAGGSEFSPAVYLYPSNTLLSSMADFRSGENILTQVAPLTAARVNAVTDDQEISRYEYEFGFVVAGDYSLGYTCVAQNDDPEAANTPDDVQDAFFIHIDQQDVTVTTANTTERNF